MIRYRLPALLALSLALAPAVLAHEGHPHPGAAAEAARFPPETLLAPNVPFVERDGRRGAFVDRFGSAGPVVISFTYASCTTVCPVANAVLAEVQEELDQVTLLTVSIDPARDTPAVMARSAEAFGAGPNWHWLAASPADTAELMAAYGVPRGPLEEHDPMFLIGDVGTGRFVRVVGLPAAEELQWIVQSVLSGR